MIEKLKRLWPLLLSTCLTAAPVSAEPTVQLEQAKNSANNRVPGEPIIIETEVDSENPYLQSMVRYYVRVFYGRNFVMGQVSEPQLDNALVLQMGDNREYTAIRGGLSYRVVERQYAIFPQRTGKLILPAPVLDGEVAEFLPGPRHHRHVTPRGMSNPIYMHTRPVRIEGKAEALSVKPRPGELRATNWLPAEQVEFTEEWQPQDGAIHVGDALWRTIAVRSRSAVGGQLPDIDAGNPDGFNVYADPVETRTEDLGDNIVGEKLRNIAFVPTQPGRFVLPELRLHWWDIRSNQERTARLPERIVDVLPAVETKSTILQSVTGISDDSAAVVSEHWLWSSFIFAALWLSTTGMWWYRSRVKLDNAGYVGTAGTLSQNLQSARKRFHAACSANDAYMARRSLLEWAALHWPENPPAGLSSLACRFDNIAVQTALDELDRALYRDRSSPWNGNQLASLVRVLPRDSTRPANQQLLPHLYK